MFRVVVTVICITKMSALGENYLNSFSIEEFLLEWNMPADVIASFKGKFLISFQSFHHFRDRLLLAASIHATSVNNLVQTYVQS